MISARSFLRRMPWLFAVGMFPVMLAGCGKIGSPAPETSQVEDDWDRSSPKADKAAKSKPPAWDHPYRGTHPLVEDDPITLQDVQRKLQQGFPPATIVTDIRWRGFIGFRDREERDALAGWLKDPTVTAALNARENTLSVAAYDRYGERLSGSRFDVAAYVKRMMGQTENIVVNAGVDPKLAKTLIKRHERKDSEFTRITALVEQIDQAKAERRSAFKEGKMTKEHSEKIESLETDLYELLTKEPDEEKASK